jgi:hypothetical protein
MKHYQDDQITENEMGCAYRTFRREGNAYRMLSENNEMKLIYGRMQPNRKNILRVQSVRESPWWCSG